MASREIDNNVLRRASFQDLANYFKQLLAQNSNQAITDHLLAGLAIDALPLRVVALWIGGFASATEVIKAIRYEESAGVRRLAIRLFGKRLRSEAWMTALWDAVGGTPGLLQLLTELSVHDVQSFCSALGRSSTYTGGREMRQRLLTEFTASLASEHFPQAKFKNPEVRPFIKFYANVVPACTEEFVRAWENAEGLPRAGGRWTDQTHFGFVRERCIKQLRADEGKTFRLERFKNLFRKLPPAPATKALSQSMLFSLQFLKHLGEHEEIYLSPQIIQRDIAIPLFKRLRRRRAPLRDRVHALEIVVQSLRPRMKSGDVLEFVTYSPLNRAFVDIWNRHADAYEDLLVQTLQLAPETQDTIQLDTIGVFLPGVRKSYRYRLLSLFLKHFKPFSKDLERDSDIADLAPWAVHIFAHLPSNKSHALLQRLIRVKDHELWRAEIFTTLLPEHAAPLLTELSRIRPAGNFLNWLHLHHKNPLFGIEHNKQVAILQLYISSASAERLQEWKTIVDERKKEATRARDQEERLEWARSAILCSIASGSLDSYEDTLLWSRRFIRDPLTAPELFGNMTVCIRDGIDLLSGIPEDINDASVTVESVRLDIRKANKIMLRLLETAFLALKEPSFQWYHWIPVLQVFYQVTERRLLRSENLQKTLSLSDEELYELVWPDTLDTIILAEKQCLKDEHVNLGAQSATGVLGFSAHPGAKIVTAPAYKFVNELVRRRDELWQQDRKFKDPNVVSLRSPWPKGLAFQDLLPNYLTRKWEGCAGRFPGLETRAESIVFADPATFLQAFPTDEQVRKAIGCHVDDYKAALDFYVQAGVDKADRTRRRQKAWYHAIGPLSKPRGLSTAQATLFWEQTFNYDPVSSARNDSEVLERPDPMLPIHIEPEAPTEWNPDPQPKQWTFAVESLATTCLDGMLQTSKIEYDHGIVLLREPENPKINFTRSAFWNDCHNRPMRTVAPAGREGLLALALMLINSKCCPSKRLFARPFPSSQDPRFPAIYLDEDFLDRDDISFEKGFAVLERLAKDAPLTLVAELCEAMLANLDQKGEGTRDFEEETLRLLKILVDGDRPNLALELVHKVVIKRPDASSWHRHMLTKGLFDRLKSKRARSFSMELAQSIKSKLQEQAQRKIPTDSGQVKPPASLIKVTTVTALAQLMSGAKFVSGQETVDLLCDIFSNASHPDICVAIVQSLTSILAKTRNESLQQSIIQALEHSAVPVASSMSERSPLTEEDWQRAESELDVPEVNDPGKKALQPVLSAILETYGTVDQSIAEQLYHRILLPILEQSASNNRRWTRIFLRKIQVPCDVDTLPPVPPRPTFLSEIMKRDVQKHRKEIFTIWGEAVLANLDPPADLVEVNTIIANDVNLRTSNAGKHWSSLWINPGNAALSLAGPFLHHPYLITPKIAKTGPVPIPLIQTLVLRQLEIIIKRSDERFSELGYVLNHLKRPEHKTEGWERTWEANVRPVIKHVVDGIESLRTPQWQRDPHRSPPALMDTYDLRLQLLTWPSWDAAVLETAEHKDKLATFVRGIEQELRQMGNSRHPYHDRFYKLKHTVRLVNPLDYCYLALHLGMLWQRDRKEREQVSLAGYLGLEMAEVLLKSAREPADKALIRKVVEMLRSWKSSEDETVRMSGLRTWRMYEDERERSMKWFWREME